MLKKYHFIITLFLFALTFSGKSSNNSSELRIALAFGPNMVLQQGEPIKIWGEAKPCSLGYAQRFAVACDVL